MDYKALFAAIGSKRFDWRKNVFYGPSLPYAALSFAQGGEDLALYKRLKYHVPPDVGGLYVDIGCGAPHHLSNTFLFYSFGWRGVCIDANPDHLEAWAKHRPEDVFICSAVGEAEGTATLFQSAEANWGIARIGEPPKGKFKPGIEVPVRRLDNILAEHVGDKPIAFMSIDVEGSEDGVLASNDWTRWKPYAVFIECTDFKFGSPNDLVAVNILQGCGYVLQDKIGSNLLFTL